MEFIKAGVRMIKIECKIHCEVECEKKGEECIKGETSTEMTFCNKLRFIPVTDNYVDALWMSNEVNKCAICKEDTRLVELNYQCPICSEKCLKKMDDGFKKAYNKK